MKNGILSLLAAIAVTASLTACQAEDTGQTPTLSEARVSEVTTQVETTTLSSQNSFETTYEITEWSADDFQSIECCGINISLPCKLSDIEEKFDTEITMADEKKESDVDMVELFFKGDHVGALCYGVDNYNVTGDSFSLYTFEDYEINGINEHSSKKNVQKILGVGNHINSEYADAYFVGNMLIIFKYYEKTFITIAIY